MSGTSVDSVDAALVHIIGDQCQYLGSASVAYSCGTRESLLSLNTHPSIQLSNYIRLDHDVACVFAEATLSLLKQTSYRAEDIAAIGSHGQTIYHQPDTHPTGTIQIGDPNRIAAITGIDVVADFRRADMARGGQGAPLVPAFHRYALSASDGTPRVILNLGGIANISMLDNAVNGFDTGPANTLLDAWCEQSTGKPFDEGGQWAREGTVQRTLLDKKLSDKFFARLPPKSTGKDHFNLSWLKQYCVTDHPPQDIQATLVELSAITIAQAIDQHAEHINEVFACGGGVRNHYLMERLALQLTPRVFGLTSDLGVDCEACEAMAFAWLASRFKANLPGNLPTVTGAARQAVLGGLYPGRTSGPQ